jgi:hypothetical protein
MTSVSLRSAALALLSLSLLTPSTSRGDGSSRQNPTATFSPPICRAGACSTTTRTVRVLDPSPVLSFATVQPATPEVGQLVALSAGATGKPPLSYTWAIDHLGTRVATLAGAAPFWATGGLPPGSYYAAVTVESPWGTATSEPIPITLSPPRGRRAPAAPGGGAPREAPPSKGAPSLRPPLAKPTARALLHFFAVTRCPSGRAIRAHPFTAH